jgi:hypothetical protein
MSPLVLCPGLVRLTAAGAGGTRSDVTHFRRSRYGRPTTCYEIQNEAHSNDTRAHLSVCRQKIVKKLFCHADETLTKLNMNELCHSRFVVDHCPYSDN